MSNEDDKKVLMGIYSEFYSLIKPKTKRKERKCLRCKSKIISAHHLCVSCAGYVNKQHPNAQDILL